MELELELELEGRGGINKALEGFVMLALRGRRSNGVSVGGEGEGEGEDSTSGGVGGGISKGLFNVSLDGATGIGPTESLDSDNDNSTSSSSSSFSPLLSCIITRDPLSCVIFFSPNFHFDDES